MYPTLSVLTGFFIAVMIAVNGVLTTTAGVYPAAVLIHLGGLVTITVILLFRKDNPFSHRQNWWLYLGGAIGMIPTVANNIAFSYISVSAMLAAELFGQSAFGFLIDQFGWFGVKKDPITPRKILGLLLVIAGIAVMVMMGGARMLGIVLSAIAGVALMLQRIVNGHLAEKTNVWVSTMWTYITGLSCAIIVLFATGTAPTFTFHISPYLYLGGTLGVVCVTLSSVVVDKVPQFTLSLLMFVGQVFTALVLDALFSGSFSLPNLIGGMAALAGLWVSGSH
jgi:transporter family-2 protein